ncbi:ATP-binding protein, partial [Streptomyces alkaliphilus]
PPPGPGGRRPRRSRRCSLGLRVVPHRVARVRRLVEEQLRRWGLPELVDAVLLGTSELVANVHRHAGPDKRCTIELLLREDRLTVIVVDHGPGLPRERSADHDARNGRGLALVAALGESWGTRVRPDGRGKAVWFTVRLPLGEARSGGPEPGRAQGQAMISTATAAVKAAVA